jgi:hypothetical protein
MTEQGGFNDHVARVDLSDQMRLLTMKELMKRMHGNISVDADLV